MGKNLAGNKFIDRSVKNALSFFKEVLSAEEIADRRGLLQSLGPGIKMILLVAALGVVLMTNDIPVLALTYLVSVILARSSGISISFFIKRVWLFIPIFTLFIAIPAIFISGLYSAAVFVLRVTTCVSFVVLVTMTTKHGILLKTLRSVGVPSIFVNILDMAYRYIYFFIKVFEDMHLGLKARLISNMPLKRSRYWIAGRMGYLFKRSISMSEGVYMAMVARGYNMDEKRNGK